jgi:predicted phosphodiesterase
MKQKPDQFQMIQELQALAIDLGRTPTRDEYVAKLGRYNELISNTFGSYSTFCAAAGLENVKPGPRKINQEVFRRDIFSFLPNQKPAKLPVKEPFETTLFIGDTHFPFVDQDVLNQIYAFSEKYKPQIIVQLGDLYDAYSHAKFPRSHNVFTPRDETRMAREMAEEFWRKLQASSPSSKCFQIVGNHDVRPMKKILEVYPEAEDWITERLKSLLTFEGVQTFYDPREELKLPGNIKVFHGYRTQVGSHRDFTLSNVVCGHSHVGGVVFRQVRDEILWELNAGYCGDPNSKGLSYTSQKTIVWTKGWGWVDEYGPRFIPAVKD